MRISCKHVPALGLTKQLCYALALDYSSDLLLVRKTSREFVTVAQPTAGATTASYPL
jgi:hypothetical protein